MPTRAWPRPTESSMKDAPFPSGGPSTLTIMGSSGPSTRRWSPRKPPPTSPQSSKSWESPASEWIEDRRQAEPLRCGGAAPRLCWRSRPLRGSISLQSLQTGPAIFQLSEDLPEKPAMHPAGYAAIRPGRERKGLGVLEMMGHLVEKRVEQFFDGPKTLLVVPRIEANQPARLVIAAQHPHGGPVIDVQVIIDATLVDPLEAMAEEGAERGDRGREECGHRSGARPQTRSRGPGRISLILGPDLDLSSRHEDVVVASLPAPAGVRLGWK